MPNITGKWMSNQKPEPYVTSIEFAVIELPGSADFLGLSDCELDIAPTFDGWARGQNSASGVSLDVGCKVRWGQEGYKTWGASYQGTWVSDTELQLKSGYSGAIYTFTKASEPQVAGKPVGAYALSDTSRPATS